MAIPIVDSVLQIIAMSLKLFPSFKKMHDNKETEDENDAMADALINADSDRVSELLSNRMRLEKKRVDFTK